MARVVLHIGPHKTGTTALQNLFWQHSAALARRGLHYPRLPYAHTGHHGLVTDWGTHLPQTYRLPAGSRVALRQIARDFAGRKGTVLLSSEEFSRADPAQQVDWRQVFEDLSGFETIEVLCVLRTPWQMLQSLYAEVSRRKSPPRPPDLVRMALEHRRFDGVFLDPAALVRWLAQHFSAQHIHLIDYHTACVGEGGLGAAVQRVLGVKPLAVGAESSNRSPRPLAHWMANLLSEPATPSPGLVSWVEGQFAHAPRQCLFTRAELASLRAGFSNCAAELADMIPGFRLSDPDPAPETLFREDIGVAFWKDVARNLAAAAKL
jgi:hypothetical protein